MKKNFGDHLILGEEGGIIGDTSSDYLWCIDPLGSCPFRCDYGISLYYDNNLLRLVFSCLIYTYPSGYILVFGVQVYRHSWFLQACIHCGSFKAQSNDFYG